MTTNENYKEHEYAQVLSNRIKNGLFELMGNNTQLDTQEENLTRLVSDSALLHDALVELLSEVKEEME